MVLQWGCNGAAMGLQWSSHGVPAAQWLYILVTDSLLLCSESIVAERAPERVKESQREAKFYGQSSEK